MSDSEWLVVTGSEAALRDFLARSMAEPGAGTPLPLWAEDAGLRFANRPHGIRGHDLVVAANAVASLRTRLEAQTFRVVASRRVARAGFEFEYEVFSRSAAALLHAEFDPAPAGIDLEDYVHEETVDPEAAGIELRGRLHDYTCRGRGRATGDVFALVALHASLRRHEALHAGAVRLELAG
jgi:hypothetical protein